MSHSQHSGKRLRLNHSSALPRYIIALDTETTPHPADKYGRKFSHTFRLAVAVSGRLRGTEITGRRVHRFSSPSDLWRTIDSLTKSNYTTWIVCHNALFDMVVAEMPERFETAQLVIDWPRAKRSQDSGDEGKPARSQAICIESPPTIIACKVAETQGRIVIVDTLNWFQCPLSDLGDSCGKPKLEMPDFSAPDSIWFDYCQRDAEIVFDTFANLIKWVKSNDMGMFRYTGPSQAIAAYRHSYITHEILLHDNIPAKIVERSAYFGGRFECFRLGKITQTVHQFDANALFPSVMRWADYPVALDSYALPNCWGPVPAILRAKDAIAEVALETSKPIFPFRTDRGVIYPVGRFKTTLVGPELVQALSMGCVRSVRAWLQYRTAPIFAKWVESLWEMRQAYRRSGDRLYEQFTKMLMNSLYGKFGQRSPEWVTIPERKDALPWMQWADFDAMTGERRLYRSFGWQVQVRQERELRHHADMTVLDWNTHAEHYGVGEIDQSFIAIAAFVTAYARVRMNALRQSAGHENCYYQGVDSLVVNDQGKANLEQELIVHPTELGKLRLQLTADYGEILGCSDYRIGDKTVIAGLSKSRVVADNGDKLQRTFSAKQHLFSGYSINVVTEELTEWQKQQAYWKGSVRQDGTVLPLVLGGM